MSPGRPGRRAAASSVAPVQLRVRARPASLPRTAQRTPSTKLIVLGTLRICVLTTSYPRSPDDPAGRFVADAVQRLRERDVDVRVVGPDQFRHFGIAQGDGVVWNIRRKPARAALAPAFLASFVRAARRAARDADLVHAHWLPTGLVALACGKPFVLNVHGTDVELARRAPRFARSVLSRARLVVAPSEAMAAAARELGAREVRVIPNGVDFPDEIGAEADPPHVLFAGRLSREKGILELREAAKAGRIPLVVAGDGPLRAQVPEALGFVAAAQLAQLYEQAAIVACPSHREGFGVVCAEAMAHGAAGRRGRRRRSARPRRRRRDRPARPARRRRPPCAPRWSACSPTRPCAGASARPAASRFASGSPGTPSPTPRSARIGRL